MCFFPFKDEFFGLYGWKALVLYGDVFRPPGKPMLLSVVLGSGCQITLTIFGTLGMLLKKYLRRSSLNFFIDICRALNNILSRRAAGFRRQAKLFELKHNVSLDGQTRQAKLSSQPANLLCVPPIIKFLHWENMGGAVALWLVCLTLEWAVCFRAQVGTLFCVLRHNTWLVLSKCLSPPRCINGYWRILYWE